MKLEIQRRRPLNTRSVEMLNSFYRENYTYVVFSCYDMMSGFELDDTHTFVGVDVLPT